MTSRWLQAMRAERSKLADERRLRRGFDELVGRSRATEQRFALDWADRWLCPDDATGTTEFDRHYVYHPAWAARILAAEAPQKHIDIASTLHFCTLLSAFMPVEFYDYRPVDLGLSELKSEFADLTNLQFESGSISSLSCMHVIEHIGLGRYGEPMDYDADLTAMKELQRVLAMGGTLLVVLPTGKPRIQFNAHRIYSYGQVCAIFSELRLVEFALVPDDPAQGGLIRGASEQQANAQAYGCGCYHFRKGTLGETPL